MRLRIALSLGLAALLVIGAAWLRAGKGAIAMGTGLTVVQNPAAAASNDPDEAKLAEIYNGAADASATTSANDASLTDTDLISRQLFSDYVSMSANGQATPASLDALGEQYASNIVSLNKASTVNLGDIKIVDNTQANLTAYGAAISAIYPKYQNLILAKSKAGIDTASDASLTPVAKSLSTIYGDEAHALASIPVPQAVASEHVKLINIYFNNAWAFGTLAKQDTDPMTAYSGLAAMQGSGDAETAILKNIENILTQHGV